MLSPIKSPVVHPAVTAPSAGAQPATVGPDSMTIQEVPRTPEREHSPTQYGSHSLDAARARTLLVVPEHVRGNMPRLRLGESRQWYALKDELKRTFIHVQWTQFLEGKSPNDQGTVEELGNALRSKLNGKNIQSRHLLDEARRYIDKKVSDLQFRHYGRSTTNLFLTKGTSLVSEVIRTEKGNFYQIPEKVDKALQQRIETQQQVSFGATGGLKFKGATGKLRFAERLDDTGSTVVAAKTHRKGRTMFTAGLTTEARCYLALPTTRHFSSVRDSAYVEDHKGQGRFYLFMDLHIRGDLVGVLLALGSRQDLDAASKQRALRTYAFQMIEAVNEMHGVGLAHRDIKPDNFLFSKDGAIVLIDFGTAAGIEEIAKGHTSGYIPPEHGDPGSTSLNGDKYSLGRTLQRIYNPFPDLDASLKKDLHEIADDLMANDPSKRPDLSEILERPCFQLERYTDQELVSLVDQAPGKARTVA